MSYPNQAEIHGEEGSGYQSSGSVFDKPLAFFVVSTMVAVFICAGIESVTRFKLGARGYWIVVALLVSACYAYDILVVQAAVSP